MKRIVNLILLLVLVTPCIPKIGFNNITIYPSEILLLLFIIPLIKFNKFKIQKDLFYIWLLITISTLYSFVNNIDFGGLMRCIKEIIYIPILYIAYKQESIQLKHLSYIFIIASIINLIFLFSQGFNFNSINIWDKELMSTGLSNRYLDLTSLTIHTLPNGSHGIWGNYCALILCGTIIAYKWKQINLSLLSVVFIFVCLNLALSVSREATISFFLVCIAFFYSESNIKGKIKIRPKFIVIASIIIIALIWLIYKYGEKMLIVQKILYTMDSINDTGNESNIQLRINGWIVFFESLAKYPFMILSGYGYNLENYSSFLDFARIKYGNTFVALPESFFIQNFCYGGFICFLLGFKFWKHLYEIIKNTREKYMRQISFGLFYALLFTNTFSGASIVSDLLYGQVLIFIGIIIRMNYYYVNKNNENIIHYG